MNEQYLGQRVEVLSLCSDFYALEYMWAMKDNTAIAMHSEFVEQVGMYRDMMLYMLPDLFVDYLGLACIGESRHAAYQCIERVVLPGRAIESRVDYFTEILQDPPDLKNSIGALVALFSSAWRGNSYGGESWANIARAVANYLSGRWNNITFIDHVWDLRHNGGLCFNKGYLLVTYGTEDSLTFLLDEKRNKKIEDWGHAAMSKAVYDLARSYCMYMDVIPAFSRINSEYSRENLLSTGYEPVKWGDTAMVLKDRREVSVCSECKKLVLAEKAVQVATRYGSNAPFCSDECGVAFLDKEKQDIESNLLKSAEEEEEEEDEEGQYQGTCAYCECKIYGEGNYYTSDHDDGAIFCDESCRDNWENDHIVAECPVCGGTILEWDDFYALEMVGHDTIIFCCYSCKNQWEEEHLLANCAACNTGIYFTSQIAERRIVIDEENESASAEFLCKNCAQPKEEETFKPHVYTEACVCKACIQEEKKHGQLQLEGFNIASFTSINDKGDSSVRSQE